MSELENRLLVIRCSLHIFHTVNDKVLFILSYCITSSPSVDTLALTHCCTK